MRVIEPHTLRPKRKKTSALKKLVIVVILVLVLGGGWLFLNKNNNVATVLPGVLGTTKKNDTRSPAPGNDAKLQYLSGPQFQELYENMMLAYPNTQPLDIPPTITGNPAADKRIRTIASSRGYELRAVPVYPITETSEIAGDVDNLLQPRAYAAWKPLKARARRDGIPLKLNSGYRSIDWQREFFLQKLRAKGLSDELIISGRGDDAIVDTLHVVAPPGYSRHHTGYTIDLWCEDGSSAFKYSKCFKWLKANNYEVAKNLGWIPSYPEDVDDQGPEPEAWEYVWVGREQLVEQRKQ